MANSVVPLPESLNDSLKSPEPFCPECASPEPTFPIHDASKIQGSTTFGVQANRFEEMLEGVEGKDREASAMQLLKKMLASAQSEEEESLALQIALGERIRQLRTENGDPIAIRQLEKALDLLREGRMQEAIRCMST